MCEDEVWGGGRMRTMEGEEGEEGREKSPWVRRVIKNGALSAG